MPVPDLFQLIPLKNRGKFSKSQGKMKREKVGRPSRPASGRDALTTLDKRMAVASVVQLTGKNTQGR